MYEKQYVNYEELYLIGLELQDDARDLKEILERTNECSYYSKAKRKCERVPCKDACEEYLNLHRAIERLLAIFH